MAFPNPTPVTHINHCANLAAIVANGSMTCCAELRTTAVDYTDVANSEIQDRRATHPVPVGPRGMVHDYVPFYFAPKSPMLFVISRGGPRYPDGQAPIIHLASTAQFLYANRPCVFTNGHAIMALSDYFSNLESLGQIDWDVMRSKMWNDTPQHPDRKRRRQAEFLVHLSVPWELITEIGVRSGAMEEQVVEILNGCAHCPKVTVQPSWYF